MHFYSRNGVVFKCFMYVRVLKIMGMNFNIVFDHRTAC